MTAAVVSAALTAVAAPAAATASPGRGQATAPQCAPARPATDFYAGGRVASQPLIVPRSACSTISVSHIRDVADASDRCQTFLVGFFPADGSAATYTDPVTACAERPSTRTVLASGVPDGAVYRVLYAVEYIEPTIQQVRYTVWH
ncbi:hypothetical protein Ate01nite_50400 [Actinoplanes teichomyceticus]|nr:hypothetical protein Ate01nite_50400 [Actinoplanes teichomyceticus]